MHYLVLSVTLLLVPYGQSQAPNKTGETAVQTPPPAGPKQLLAVRGQITKVTSQGKGLLAITVRPAKDFAEVTVIARENEAVACFGGREGGTDLFGLLTGEDQREDEKIT